MPWYTVKKIRPGGKGLFFNGREFSKHTFATKADPQKAKEEQVYIDRLRKQEAAEQARLAKEEKKRKRRKE